MVKTVILHFGYDFTRLKVDHEHWPVCDQLLSAYTDNLMADNDAG